MNPQASKGTIMYIEDEVEALRTMIKFLNIRGYGVVVALTAEEGYDRLREYDPVIILIDIKLVGQNGIDFIKKIRKEGIDVPIIVITAYPQMVTEMELKELNIHGYFIKPFSYADLFKTINKTLEIT